MADNKLKTFFANFGKLGAVQIDRAVGIDIGSSEIKVVEIKKKKGKAVLETYGAISLGSYAELDPGRVTYLPAEKLVEALNEVLKQSGVSTTSSALSIPAQSSLIFTIELPSQIQTKEMSDIVTTEARKYIPVPMTEVSLDWFPLPKKEASFKEVNDPEAAVMPQEKTRVLVIATQNEAISKYRQIVSGCGLNAGFFEIEIFSSIRANFEHELSLVLLIDFGASRTKLSLVEFGMVSSFHSISRGGADISESIAQSMSVTFAEAEKIKKEFGLFGNPAEKSLSEIIKTHTDYIFNEASSAVLAYEKKYNRTISKVILTGGGALMKGIKEVAANTFQVEVQVGHPFSKVEAPAFIEKVLDAMGPEFGVALGLALRKLQ